jgi:glycine betaine catabolism B
MPVQISVPVKEVIKRTYNVKSIRVEVKDPAPFHAGQFLTVTLKPGPEFKRYLSISNSPTEKGYIEFTKKLSDSLFSQALDALKPGDMVTIQYPMGKFVLDESHKKHCFLSGGIGITPLYSMAKYAADARLDCDIILLYSNRTVDDIAFKDDLCKLQAACPRLKVIHVLCETAPDFACISGVIDAAIIRKQIPDYLERKFYLCGPPGMVKAMENILSAQLHLPPQNIITENFQGYQ